MFSSVVRKQFLERLQDTNVFNLRLYISSNSPGQGSLPWRWLGSIFTTHTNEVQVWDREWLVHIRRSRELGTVSHESLKQLWNSTLDCGLLRHPQMRVTGCPHSGHSVPACFSNLDLAATFIFAKGTLWEKTGQRRSGCDWLCLTKARAQPEKVGLG